MHFIYYNHYMCWGCYPWKWSTEASANAFSPWPLLLYLIINNSANLHLIGVCHGEAHWASVGGAAIHNAHGSWTADVWGQRRGGGRGTVSPGAGPPSPRRLSLPMSQRHTGVEIQSVRQTLCLSLYFSESQVSGCVEMLGLSNATMNKHVHFKIY